MSSWTKYKKIFFDLRYGVIIFVLFILGTIYTYSEVNEVVQANIEKEYTSKVNEIIREIEYQVNIYSNSLLNVKGLFSASDRVDRGEWSIFIQNKNIKDNYPAVRAYEYAKRVEDSEVEDFEQAMEIEGFSNFKVYPSENRENHFVVVFIEPDESNEGVYGFDLASNSERLTAIEYARDTKDFAITPPISLIQEGDEKGFLELLAVYDNSKPSETLKERRENLAGSVLALIEYETLFDLISDRVVGLGDFHVLISDDGENIYDNLALHDLNFSNRILELEFKNHIDFGGRTWEIELYPTQRFFDRFSTQLNLPILVLYSGTIVGFLLMLVIYVLSRSRRIVGMVAQEMTDKFESERRVVKEKNENLKKNLSQIEEQKKDLEKQKRDLERLNSLMIGREMAMSDLKKKIKDLTEKQDEA